MLAQLESHRADAEGNFHDRTADTAMIAVQGPAALATVQPLYNQPLEAVKYYHLSMGLVLGDVTAVVSRTGYTGEDGYELIVGAGKAERVWNALLESGQSHGIAPCGLGARDTLRFEAAMPLYGHELSDSINPYAAGRGLGREAGQGRVRGPRARFERWKARRGRPGSACASRASGSPARGPRVLEGDRPVGTVTSGTFAPTLQASLAMALVEPGASRVGTRLALDVRGHREPAQVVELPFYRRISAEQQLNPISTREPLRRFSKIRESRTLHHGPLDASLRSDTRMGAS